MDLRLPERAHWPFLPAQTGIECRKVQGHDMQAGHTPVRGVREGGGTMVHGQGGDVPREAKNMNTMPILRNRVYCRIDDGTKTVDTCDRA